MPGGEPPYRVAGLSRCSKRLPGTSAGVAMSLLFSAFSQLTDSQIITQLGRLILIFLTPDGRRHLGSMNIRPDRRGLN
jgi:hypothetical protein